MRIINKGIEELKPYAGNPRRHGDADIEATAEAIRQVGFKVPCLITPDDELITGHGRVLAAKRVGLTEVPCIVADDLTPEQVRYFRTVDNRTSELSKWDESLLQAELASLADDFDMSLFAFEEAKLAESLQTVDVPVPDEIKPRVKRGDVWALGQHRVMCGDATSADDVKLAGGGHQCQVSF